MKLLTILLSIFIVTPSAGAQEQGFSEYELKKIKQAEDYINNMTTMEADFTQISPYSKVGLNNISLSEGKVYLSRPGSALWEYHKPTSQVIHINKNKVVYYDKELDQISYVDIDRGLSSFLTADSVDFFNGTFKVVSFKEDETGFGVVLQDDKDVDGEFIKNEQLRLTFVNNPLELRRFNFKDVRGYITTVEFRNSILGASIDKEKFVFKNPRIGKNVWEKK